MWGSLIYVIFFLIIIHLIILIFSIIKYVTCKEKKYLILLIYCSVIVAIALICRISVSLRSSHIHKAKKILPPDNNSKSYKTITYNINALPFSNKGTKYHELIQYLNKFDIIMIQEAFYDPIVSIDKKDLIEYLNLEGYDVVVSPSPEFFSFSWGDSGLLIAIKTSRDRIVDFDYKIYSESSSIDNVSDKGILYCKTKNNINIYNTHCQAGYVNMWPDDGLHEDTRISQLYELIEFKNFDTVYPIICGGDFNFRSDEEVNIVKNKYKFNSQNGLDAIFSTNAMVDVEYTNPFDSDHYSLEASVII